MFTTDIYYFETFHLIDKGNGAEVKYDLGGQSRMHVWTPKLSSRLFNLNFNNSYRINLALMTEHNPGRIPGSLVEGIKEAIDALLQRGIKTRTRAPDHPSPVMDMRSVYNTECGKRKRSDAKGVTIAITLPPVTGLSTKLHKLRNP